MSHSQIFMSFRGCDLTPIPLLPLVAILEDHGCKVAPRRGDFSFVEFPLIGDDYRIGCEGSIGFEDAATVEFGINRPYYQNKFYSLALDLVTRLDLCMFTSGGEVAFVSREELIADLPQALADVAVVVQSVKDLVDGI